MATIAIASFINLTTQGLSSHFPNLSFPFSSLRYSQFRTTFCTSMATTPIQVSASSSSSSPTIDEKKGAGFAGMMGANDLLIVGPGVLGRLVAEKWREEHPGCEIYGQTVTVDHHEELIKDTPVVPIGRSPRTDVLLNAEKVVLEFGGVVLRLTGLYKADRGAHVYWLSKGTVDANPDHVLNLIHYEDAASLSVAILKKRLHNQILLGCDNHPLSRKEVMDLVNKSGKFTKVFDSFTGTTDPLGKRLNNSKTRAEIGWEPKYPSFSQFLESL